MRRMRRQAGKMHRFLQNFGEKERTLRFPVNLKIFARIYS